MEHAGIIAKFVLLFLIPKALCMTGNSRYPISALSIPTPAPVTTSLTQCFLFSTRKAPVAVATPYQAMPIQGDTSRYSLNRIWAPVKAMAVWPDGNESLLLPSGRVTERVLFMVLTTIPMMAYELAVIRARSLRL